MKPVYQNELQSDPSFIGLIPIAIGFIIVLLLQYNMEPKGTEFYVSVVAVSIISIGASSVLFNRRTTLILTNEHLIVEKTIAGISRVSKFRMSEIDNIRFDTHVKSDTYVSLGHVHVLGVDKTPESMKNYYHHPEIVSFSYRETTIQIGKWKQAFDGQDLADALKQIKEENGVGQKDRISK